MNWKTQWEKVCEKFYIRNFQKGVQYILEMADLLKDNLPNILMYNCFKFDNYFLGKEISELKTTFPNTSDF